MNEVWLWSFGSCSNAPRPPIGALRSRVLFFSANTEVLLADGVAIAIADVRVGDATVTTTEDHEFWNVTDQAWQETQHIDAGDLLLTAAGATVEAGSLLWDTAHVAPAFDLTIDGIHAYHITAGDESVLVQNNNARGCDPPDPDSAGDDAVLRRSIELELDSAAARTRVGQDIDWIDDSRIYDPDRPETWLLDDNGNQPPNPSKNPDYLVDGEFHDVKSPTTNNPRNALENSLETSVQAGQAQNLDINLGRSDVTTADLERVLDEILTDDFGGDQFAFADEFSFTAPDGSVFPVESISVIEGGNITRIWPVG